MFSVAIFLLHVRDAKAIMGGFSTYPKKRKKNIWVSSRVMPMGLVCSL